MKERYDAFKSTLEQYNGMRDRIVELAAKDDIAGAIKLLGESASLAQKTDGEIKSLFQAGRDEGVAQSDAYSASTRSTITTMVLVVVVAMAVAIVLGLFISSMIGKPIRKMVDAAERIASGDLTRQIDVSSKDETGQLAAAFRRMNDNLNEVVSNIQAASDQVAAGGPPDVRIEPAAVAGLDGAGELRRAAHRIARRDLEPNET
ncbi:HAMP domain-containing protein [Cohnella rhizosphaerae]|uniref:histidine kinase n=1 Tax=Cohnella rhizosphaerae TaxID=1457232 RepID=A0A9X4KZD1_9BACL|nr:HAMP domain-containing protein [Cohnella rhizosphaerae]MDG0813665.1 HAMP domain-containing protein [Cohnella rhizosphaerae]